MNQLGLRLKFHVVALYSNARCSTRTRYSTDKMLYGCWRRMHWGKEQECARHTVVIRKQGVSLVIASYTVTQPTTGDIFLILCYLQFDKKMIQQ